MNSDFDAEAFDAGCGRDPPPGVISNYDNPADAGWSANIAVTTVLVVIATVCCSMRFATRLRISSPSRLEDVLCAFAWFFIILYCSVLYAMGHFGEGRNIWEISCQNYINFLQLLWVCSLAYTPAALCVKVALLVLEARIFEVFFRVAKWLRIFAIFTACAYVIIEIAKIAACPIQKFWDPDEPCYNQRKVFVADRCMAILTDLVITIVPIPLVYQMNNLSRLQKIKVVVMLGAGGFATGATIFRMYRGFLFIHSTNVTADYVIFNVTAQIELAIAITCLCLPSINLLLFRKRPEAESSANTASGAGSAGSKPDARAGGAATAPLALDLELAEFDMNPSRSSDDGRREGWLSHDSNGNKKETAALRSRTRNMSWERAWDNESPGLGLGEGQGLVPGTNATAPQLPAIPSVSTPPAITTTTTTTMHQEMVRWKDEEGGSRSSGETPRDGQEWPWDGEEPQKHAERTVV